MTESLHFEVIRAIEPGPVVVEIPHAGLGIDPLSARFTKIPAAAAEAESLLADSDIGADRLWDGAESRGVTRVVARTSRHVIDLNTTPRLPTPSEEKLPDAMREVRHRSHSGAWWWIPPLPRTEIERRIAEIAEPYHAAIRAALEAARARHGRALLLSSHTFPNAGETKADVVIGTLEGRAAPRALRDAIAETATRLGFDVALEAPFPGAWSLSQHGRPHEGIAAVQVEIAHRLFARRAPAADGVSKIGLDEDALARCGHLVSEVVATAENVLADALSSR